MKREKMMKNGETVYYFHNGRVQECKVLYSAYELGIKERYYMTDGLSFVHSDVGSRVFRTANEAMSKKENFNG